MELWVVFVFICRKWSYAIGGNMVTRKQDLVEGKALVDTFGTLPSDEGLTLETSAF